MTNKLTDVVDVIRSASSSSPSLEESDAIVVYLFILLLRRLQMLVFVSDAAVGGSIDLERVDRPVVALARVAVMTWHFNEALVKGEVMSNGVLPTVTIRPIVGKVLDDELVDLVQCQSPPRAAAYRHHDQRVVTESWLIGCCWWWWCWSQAAVVRRFGFILLR